MLFLGSKAPAVLQGEAYVTPDDVRDLAAPVLRPHRAQPRSGNRGDDRRPVRRPGPGAGRGTAAMRGSLECHGSSRVSC